MAELHAPFTHQELILRDALGLGAGVRVNCVSSGLILTESERGAITPEFERFVESINCVPYFGQPEDIAAACLYLCSDEARYVSGATLCVDGGASI